MRSQRVIQDWTTNTFTNQWCQNSHYYPDQYKDIDMVGATKEFYSNFYHYDLSDDQAKQILLDSGINESNL